MTTRYNLCAPVTYKDTNGQDVTRYTKVGAVFENTRRDTGEAFLSIKLDFPVGLTDLVAFVPKSREDD